jgi:hypothetical protein
MTVKELAGYFQYLDELRKSGETNMYGAGPYLRGEFGFNRKDTTLVLLKWMETFDRNKTTAERAALALRGA